MPWQYFRWDQIDVLFDLRRNRSPTFFKWCELPLKDFVLQLWPELLHFSVAVSIGIYNIPCGRNGQRKV